MSEAPESGHKGGWSDSLRRFGDSTLGLLQTRLEILALEWIAERGKLARLLFVVFGILVCLQLALVTGLLFLLLVVGEANRVAVLGFAALALLIAAAGGALGLRAWLRRQPPMFGTTISELRKDRDWLRGRP